MNLLFDENISYRVLKYIINEFPNSQSIFNLKNILHLDLDIWNYAKVNDFLIVTFDSDFYDWKV